jgi:hypothetical protein
MGDWEDEDIPCKAYLEANNLTLIEEMEAVDLAPTDRRRWLRY